MTLKSEEQKVLEEVVSTNKDIIKVFTDHKKEEEKFYWEMRNNALLHNEKIDNLSRNLINLTAEHNAVKITVEKHESRIQNIEAWSKVSRALIWVCLVWFVLLVLIFAPLLSTK